MTIPNKHPIPCLLYTSVGSSSHLANIRAEILVEGRKHRLHMISCCLRDKVYRENSVWTVSYTHLDVYKRQFLSMHPGQVFDKERIYAQVCGYDAEGDLSLIHI